MQYEKISKKEKKKILSSWYNYTNQPNSFGVCVRGNKSERVLISFNLVRVCIFVFMLLIISLFFFYYYFYYFKFFIIIITSFDLNKNNNENINSTNKKIKNISATNQSSSRSRGSCQFKVIAKRKPPHWIIKHKTK